MNIRTKMVAVLVSGVVLLGNTFAAESPAAQAGEITVRLDGEKIVFADQNPLIKEGRTLVPIRSIFEKMGAEVSWDDETKTVTVEKDEKTVLVKIGDTILLKNGEEIKIDVPAEIQNGRTLLPLRAVSEALDCYVTWNDAIKTAFIYDLDETDKKDQVLMGYMQEGVYSIYNHMETEYGTVLHIGMGTSRGASYSVMLIDENGEIFTLSEAVRKEFPYNKPQLENLQLSADGKTLTYSVSFSERGIMRVTRADSDVVEEVVLYEAGTYHFSADLEGKTSTRTSFVPLTD